MTCALSLWPPASDPQPRVPNPQFLASRPQHPASSSCRLSSLCSTANLQVLLISVVFLCSACSWVRINGALLAFQSMSMYTFGRQAPSVWVCPTAKARSGSLVILVCTAWLRTQWKESTHIWCVERACCSPEVGEVGFISRDWKDLLQHQTRWAHCVKTGCHTTKEASTNNHLSNIVLHKLIQRGTRLHWREKSPPLRTAVKTEEVPAGMALKLNISLNHVSSLLQWGLNFSRMERLIF